MQISINWAKRENYGSERETSKIKFIVIHYTAVKGDTAAGEAKYFAKNVLKTSAHYFVDDNGVFQSVPDTFTAWHCGGQRQSSSGGKFFGECNNTNSIGVELCGTAVRDGEIYVSRATIDNALCLVKMLMEKYEIPHNRVIRHFDVNGKICPKFWTNDEVWESEFKNHLVCEKTKVELLPGTDKNPLKKIGVMAGVCWGSDSSDDQKNIDRAKSCISSGHGRVMEFVDVEMVLSGWSARAIRELYTHIGGSPTRLQESTRYVDCAKFEYYTPSMSSEAEKVYNDFMSGVKESYKKLLELGVSKEDAANVLPLGMHTKVVMKCNLRMLENFMNQRLCSRAYKEMRQLARTIRSELSKQGPEWSWICETLFVPKCAKIGKCPEKKGCGLYPSKENF